MTRKLLVWAVLYVGLTQAFGQATVHAETKGAEGQVQLSLSVEVATTNDEGYPTALRIVLKNVGAEAVDLPLAPSACELDGGIEIEMRWTADDPSTKGKGWGHGCGSGDRPSLPDRVRDEYLRLRPGEYFVFTQSIRDRVDDLSAGTLEYWVMFTPPQSSKAEFARLVAEHYNIPTRKVESEHFSFHVR